MWRKYLYNILVGIGALFGFFVANIFSAYLGYAIFHPAQSPFSRSPAGYIQWIRLFLDQLAKGQLPPINFPQNLFELFSWGLSIIVRFGGFFITLGVVFWLFESFARLIYPEGAYENNNKQEFSINIDTTEAFTKVLGTVLAVLLSPVVIIWGAMQDNKRKRG